jgi:hypothetical protein
MPNLKAVREDLDNGDLAGAASDFGSSCDRWSTADLVELHNDLAPKKVKAWKKSKLLLIAKIDDMLLAMAEGKMPEAPAEKPKKQSKPRAEKKPSVCSVLRDQLANGLEIDLKQFAEQQRRSRASARSCVTSSPTGLRST